MLIPPLSLSIDLAAKASSNAKAVTGPHHDEFETAAAVLNPSISHENFPHHFPRTPCLIANKNK